MIKPLNKDAAAILEFIRLHPGVIHSAICVKFGWEGTRVSNFLDTLVKKKLIRKEVIQKGVMRTAYYYFIRSQMLPKGFIEIKEFPCKPTLAGLEAEFNYRGSVSDA